MYNMNNYYSYWAKRLVNDGLRYIKLVLGLGLTVVFGMKSLVLGALFFGYVIVDTLIQKQ